MKLISFSFKREPVWMLVFSLAAAVAGIFVALVVMIVRSLR